MQKRPRNRSFFWSSRRESNSQLILRRDPLYPFNYGKVYAIFTGYSNTHLLQKFLSWSPNRSPNFILAYRRITQAHGFERFLHRFAPFCRVHFRNSSPLGGVYYIHLTTEAFYKLQKRFYRFATCLSRNRPAKSLCRISYFR